jgi:hypothetical protein
MTVNERILSFLREAPDSQLSAGFKKKCQEFSGDAEALKQLLMEIHNATISERSNFVRALCDPIYIKTDDYMYKEKANENS